MTGLGSSHGYLHRLVITHFAQKDHIRTLTQGGAEGNQIAFRICADLTLADDASVMPVKIFKWIFQSDDMPLSGMINAVDQACHSS